VPAFERGAVPNPNANTANAMTKHFFPIIEEFLLLFPRFNPTMTTKLPSKWQPQILIRLATMFFGSPYLSKSGTYAS
jgi:hypothetical protein